MNKIFKVIWSKSKQCYIVVSEIAKNKTGKKKIVVASILAALTMTANVVTVEGAIPEGSRTDQLGLAIGTSSNSKSNQSVAIGYASSAQAPGANPENPATAVGAGANANGAGAVALGLSANATGANAVALGGGSNGGTNKTEATATNATAVGFNAKASKSGAAAIGAGANASGSDSISLGTDTVANSEKAIAIGANSKGTAIGATALGRDTEASGASATALGALASAKGSTATAIGMQASATGNESVAIGQTASATSGRALAVGTNAKATGASSVAVGSGAVGSGAIGFAGSLNSTAGVVNTNKTINYATTAEGDNAVALGYYANAKNSGVAVGQKALAETGGVAIGKGVLESTGNNLAGGVAIGQDSASTGVYSLAMGFNAFASGSTSMAIGHTVSADGGFAVAMGRKVSASGTSTAIGHHATASNGGLAIGSQENDTSNDRTTASAKGAVAIGKNTKATSEDAVAIGTNAQSTLQGAVAIGSGSTTATGATNQGSTTINGITYNFAGATGNPNMQVSVGSAGATRQIKNVAAGEVSATSTDAINGSQLYAVASAVKPLKYVSVNSTATSTGSNVDNDGAQGGNSIAIGPFSSVTRQNGIAIGNGAQSLSEESVVIGRNAKAETKAGASLTTTSRAIAIGSNSRVAADVTQGIAIGSGNKADEGAVVTGDQSIAIGGNVRVDGHGAIAIGGDDATKATTVNVTYTTINDTEVPGTLRNAVLDLTGFDISKFKGTTALNAAVAYGTSAQAGNAGVAIGTGADSITRKNDKGQVVSNNPVTNAVAIGTGARANFDNSVAIGGGSNTDHYATKQVNAVIDGVEVKWSGGENISPGDVVSFGAKGFERQLKNVAPGEVSQTSTDAVNGSQIYSLARKVTNIMNGGSGSVVNVNATGEPLSKVSTIENGTKVEKYYRTVDVKDDGTLATGAIAQTPASLALVNVAQTDTNKQTQTPRILGNVANGVKDNDAVNVSQLNAAKVKYFSVNSSDAGNVNNNGATGTDAIAIGPSAISNDVGAVALGKDAKANGAFTVALGGGNWQFKGAQANGVGTTALGSNTKTQENTNYQTVVGFGANTTNANATAIGYNAAVSTEGGVALGANSSSSTGRTMGYNPNDGRTNTYGALTGNVIRSTTGAVAVGNGTDVTRQITGVAAGTNDTDAVNVAQLKSVNLAFVGDSGFGDVNLANNDTSKRFAVKGDSTYLTTRANGNLITVSANKKDISVTNGTARADTGLADAKNVAEAINKVVSQNAYTWNLTADNDTAGSRSTINKEDTVKFSGDQNITVKRDGNTITSSLNKSITVDSVKANKSVTTGSGTNQITLDGTTGAVTGRTFSGQSFTAGDNVLSNTTLQIGPSTGGNNVSITRDGLTAKTGTKTVKFGTSGIDAGGQQITNVSSGGNVGTNAANITDVNTAVSGVTLKLDSNSKTGTVKLSDGPLKITGANGIRTDLIGTNNSNLVIGLDSNTINATTNGIGLSGDSGTVLRKFLKDGHADFKISGDGGLVTTSGTATGVQVSVDKAKVKDLAVEAVTVSKATNISDNPITVTPTAGTNSKDYAIGIDTTKLAAKTNLAYTANGATAKTVSLAKGLNFVNGTNTVATVDSEGKVSFDLNQATKDSINKSATAVGRTITLNADSGTGSSQSLSNGNVSFAVSGATGDYISTTMDGSAVKVSTKRATIDSDANTGKASVTGADGLATAKNVASAINSAVNGLSQNLNISDGTKDSSVALKSQKLTVTGTGAAKATVNNQTITVDVAEGTLTPNTTDGSVTGTTGVAKATEVAVAINNTKTVLGTKIDKNAADIATNKGNIATNTADIATNKGKIATNTANIATNTANIAHTIALADDKGASTTAKSLKDGNVSFNIKGDNKFISTAASGNDVTLTVNEQAIKDAAKNASSFKVKANAHAEEEVKGGDTIAFNNGDNIEISQTGKTFTIGTAKNITVDSVTAGNTVINTSGLTNGTTAITGTGVTTDKVTVGGISIDKTDGINAGGKVISNVASGGTTDTNAANIGDVKQAVANLSQNLNITDGTNNGTIDLKNQKLNVTGANGVTATVNNQTITVGLDANTVNATTKGIGLTADTGSTGNKYLKDGDVSFAVTGDGNLVSTSATAAGVKVAVDAAKVKDLAVSAVTVSKDAQADNPITVTPTAGTNSKDYAIGIDTTKLAAKTDLTYRANSAADANAKKVSLSKGLDFVDGGSTVATVDNDGKVSFDLNTATKTQINTNTADIATNKGNITKNAAAIATNAAAIARNITLGADAGTASSQSLSKADVAFNVKGATGDFVSTNMNGNTVEISTTRATINSNATTGEASVTGADGLATAKNVSDAINKAAEAAKAGAAWNITTNSSTTDKTAVKGGDTVDLVNGDNIEITQDGTDKKKITVATKKDITVDSVTANNKVTVGSGANAITLNGADGSVTGKAFTGTTFTGTSFTAGNTVINTNGLTNGTTAITGTGVTTDTLTVGGVSIDKTDGINAGGKVISNVASGGTTATNAANIGDIQTAVGNQNLKFAGNTNTAAGVVNIKDDTFNIVGDGKYVSTDANGKNLTVKVSEAEVKKSAVAAVTVSTDTTDTNNPLTVTPTTSADGTTKDYKVTIDGTKIANKTNLSYKANDGTAKQVSLADGLNFKNGTLTTASIDDAGVVKYDVNTATITAGTDGTITGPTTDGVATGQNVADAINAAKKASKTEITANTGEAANATKGNVTLTSTTAADGHTIYDVKLNDKVILGTGANAVTIDGTTGKATVGTAVVDGVNNTITTGGANTVALDGAAGTVKTGTVTVTGGTTNDITGLSNTTVNSADFATKGRAATEEQLKAVGEQTWQITADKDATTSGNQTGTKKDAKVGKDDKVQLIAGENITVNQNERDFTYSLNKDLVKMNSATFEATGGKTTVIKGDSIVQTDGANVNTSNATSNTITDGTNTSTITAGKAQIGTVGIDGVVSKITTGGANAVVINGADGTAKTGTVTVTGGTTNDITGLSNTSLTGADFATKGRAATEEQLKAATSATTLKFTGDVPTNTGSVNLKDDTFGIKGDGKYIATDVNGKNVNLTVSEAEVKKSAVAAVTVSTDTTDANNPISVTPTTSADGTTKDYKVTIDGTKIANKTNLSYKANDGTAKQVSLADGLNFKNGTLTTASIDDAGVVKYDVNTATITAGTDGTVTGPTTDGVATAQNVADAINAAKKASKTEITANTGEAANATTGNVNLTSTTAADGHTIYDVKLNDKVTLGTGTNAVTIDGTAGKATVGTAVVDGVNNTITTGGANAVTLDGAAGTVTGLTNKDWTPGVTKAVTGRAATEDQLQKVADAASSQTWNITADKAGTTGAQTGTKKNATVGKDETVELVAGDNLTINQDERKFTYSLNKDLAGLTSVSVGDGTTETIKLDGATGKVTAKNAVIGGVTVDGDNSHVTGLSNTTWNGTATTGRAATEDQLKAVADTAKATTDAVNLKFSGDTNTSAGVVNLKDDTFNIVGDGKYVTTDANGKDLTVKVSEAEVKKSAVAAVTVSTDTTDANNPISVTPTTSADGTTKDYKVTIDGTKIANKTNLSYKANDGTAKQVSLADGLNFKNGTLTTASIDDAGVVKYDVNTAAITASTDGTVTGPTTDGVATAQNVADAINAAKKAAKTEITANTGEAANATTGNVTLTSTTAADGHTIYDVKLNDKVTLGTGNNAVTIDGTAGKATIGSSVVDGVNNTITTGGANAVALDGAAGTVKTGTVIVTGGTTNDITGLSNTTVTSADFATKGRAATEEQLKAVGEQTWQITADKDAATSGNQTGTKKDAKVGKDDKVQLIAGENLTVNQNERDFTYALNKDLVKMNSATFEATGGKTTVITGDSITQTDGTKTNTSTAAGNTVADGTKSTETTAAGQVIKDGAKTNTSTVDENTLVDGAKSNKTTVDSNVIDDGNGNVNTSNATSNTITDGTNTSTVTAGKAQIGTVGIDGVASKVTTGGANAVVINGADGTVKTGTVTVTGGTTNDITGLSNTTVNSADFATKGRAATEEQLKAVGEQTWQITADKDATTSGNQTGTKKDAKVGKDDKVQLIAGENLTVNQNERDFTYSLNKDLVKMNSATFEATGGKTTVITGDSIAQTDGTKTNTSTAAGNTVADGVKSTETTAAGQVIKDGAKSNKSTVDSNVIDDGNGNVNTSNATSNTIANGADSTATTAAGTIVTNANGNTNYAADGVRINTTGKNPVSLTDAGLDNGNNVIKNVASGHVNNDDTDNTNAANIADVKKATTTVTANNGEAANATTGNVTLTSTTAADGHTIYDVKLNDKVTLGTGNNAVTIDGTAGKAIIGSSVVDGVNNTITTGGANAVKLDGTAGTVKTGTVTVTGGTTNDITGLSNTTVNSADFATKGRAATEEQLKAVGEQTWQITADKEATTSGNQTGTKKDAKVGKDDKVQLIAGENLTVNQNERDFTYSLNKDLMKMNSATFEATGGKTTVITGDSIAQTDGTKTNRSTAAGNTVADGTKSTETTAAGQVIKDGAKTNTSTVDENTLVDGAKSNKTTVDSNVIDDGNGNVNTSNATSNTITDGTNTTEATASTVTVKDNAGNSTVITKDTITTGTGVNKVTVDGTAGKVTAGSAVVDGVNNTITTGGANTVKLDGAAGTVTGLTNTTWAPGVTKAVSGRAATEDQLQQVSDAVGAGWNINSGTVAGSTGEANGSAKTKISSGEEVQLQAGNNLIIDQNGKTLAYSLNKNLKDMESAIFNATGGKTTVIKGDSIVQTDGGKTNTSNATGNTVVDGTKSTATTAAGTTITDGAKTNTSTADKNVIDDGAGNTNTSNATSNTIADPNGNTNTATATNNTLADNAGNANVSNATSNSLTDNAGNSNISNATSNTLKNAAGDETKVDAKGATVKDAAGNTTNVASTGATVTNAAGDTTKVEATGTTVADAAGNKATFTKDGVTITKPGKDTVSLTGNGLDNGNNKIVNVADGTNDTDAVNVRQLDAKTKAATTELTANGGESADNTTGNIVLTKTTAPDGHIIYDNKLNDKITLGAADPTKAITVDGTNGIIKAGTDGNAVAINGTDGTIKAGDGTNAVAIDGVNGSVKVADKIALNGKDGKAAIGTVGIDGKDGIITTGGNNPVAVNGKDGIVTGLTNKTWDSNNITSGRAATEDQVQSAVANAGWDATVGTEGSGVNSTPSAAPEKIRPNETLTFKAGNNMMVSHAGKTISYAVNPELTDMKSATFKDAAGNTTVTNGNGITITPGSANPNNPNAGPVSLTKDGLNNGNNQIKGVAPGSDDTDAVNIAQLKASNANTSQAINQVAGEVQRVGAHAAAMAALKPIQYDPLEPTQIMAGVGNYRGETAAALGLAHYTNEDTMFNVGVSVGGNHNMVNAGVTHKFGSSPEKKNIPDRYKAGPISSVYVMQDEVSSLKKENAEQKYVIADQAARLNTLEAENERQRQELAETKQGLDDLRAAVDRLLAAKG